MHLIQTILLPAIFSIAGVTATPISDATPGLIVEYSGPGQMAVNETISIGGTPGTGLQKRVHQECYSNYITIRSKQEAYIDDCKNLIAALGRSTNLRKLYAKGQYAFKTNQKICKIIVRNQSSCGYVEFAETAVAINADNTISKCNSFAQHSGWGYMNNKDTQFVYIVEPYQLAPPTYSPYCDGL